MLLDLRIKIGVPTSNYTPYYSYAKIVSNVEEFAIVPLRGSQDLAGSSIGKLILPRKAEIYPIQQADLQLAINNTLTYEYTYTNLAGQTFTLELTGPDAFDFKWI